MEGEASPDLCYGEVQLGALEMCVVRCACQRPGPLLGRPRSSCMEAEDRGKESRKRIAEKNHGKESRSRWCLCMDHCWCLYESESQSQSQSQSEYGVQGGRARRRCEEEVRGGKTKWRRPQRAHSYSCTVHSRNSAPCAFYLLVVLPTTSTSSSSTYSTTTSTTTTP